MATPEERHQRALRIFGGPAGLAVADDYVNRIADTAPPLSIEQKARLRALLRCAPPANAMIPAPLKHAA